MNIMIYIYVALWPLFNQYVIIDLGSGIPDITVQILLVPLLMISTVLAGKSKSFGEFAPWLFLFILYSLITSVFHANTSTLHIFQLLIQVYALPYMIYFILFNNRDKVNYKYLSYAIIIGGLFISATGVAEFIAGKNLIGKVDYDESIGVSLYRTNGPFHDSIGYASLLLLYLSYIYYSYSKDVLPKKFLLISSIFIGFGSFVNFSRAAILGLLVVFVSSFSKNPKKLFVMLFVGFIVSVPILFIFSDIVDQITSSKLVQQRTDTQTMEVRWSLYNYVLDTVVANPLLGIGYDNFILVHGGATHNSYLQVLVELGFIGLIIFLIFIWKLVVSNIRDAIRRKQPVNLRTMMGIGFVVLFIPNTIVLLQSPHFMTILMIVIGAISAHEKSSALSESSVELQNDKITLKENHSGVRLRDK